MIFVGAENNLHLFEVCTLGRIMGKSIVITKLTINAHRKTQWLSEKASQLNIFQQQHKQENELIDVRKLK